MSNVDPAIEKSIRDAVAAFREPPEIANYLIAWFEELTTNSDDREVDLQRLDLVLSAMTAPAHLTES